MSRYGNLNADGSVRVDLEAGTSTFAAGTNNGAFESIAHNAEGDATIDIADGYLLSFADVVDATILGSVSGAAIIERLSATQIRLRTQSSAGALSARDVALTITRRLFG